jgi:hypothetical protein
VFDEGHHLFDAADAMFSAALTGQEAIEIRRWITGPESGSRGRRRGLAARLSDVASYDEEGGLAIAEAVDAARALPSDGWLQRLNEGEPFGPVEALLAAVRGLVYARDVNGSGDAVRRSTRSSAHWSSSGAGSKRCSPMRPTGWTVRRAPASKARSPRSAGGPRPSAPGSR